MEPIDLDTIRAVGATLAAISRGDRVGFNVARYSRLGLVEARPVYGYDASGFRVVLRHAFGLTAKGGRMLVAASSVSIS